MLVARGIVHRADGGGGLLFDAGACSVAGFDGGLHRPHASHPIRRTVHGAGIATQPLPRALTSRASLPRTMVPPTPVEMAPDPPRQSHPQENHLCRWVSRVTSARTNSISNHRRSTSSHNKTLQAASLFGQLLRSRTLAFTYQG